MSLPEIGTLYQNPSIPMQTWTQPGGPGTTVYPQAYDSARGFLEAPLNPTGQYVPGCGHASNILRIWEVYDSDTNQQAALICCPVCTFIVRIIEPYSAFDDYIVCPIVIA